MIPFPTDDATGESYCGDCGTPDPSPSVEAFEVFGLTVCHDCGIAMLAEDGDE